MRILILAGVLSAVVSTQAFSAEEDLPIKRLSWLIGEWQTYDEQLAGDYTESGPRNCEWGLNDRYIVCRGVGTNNRGKSREYIWYFNYNHMEERFEMNSLYGDWPRKNLFIIELSDDNHQFTAMSYFFKENGLEPGNPQSVVYNGTDQYVWTILNGDPDSETGEPTPGFVDTATRVSK